MSAIRSGGNKATELKLATIFRENGIAGWRRNYPLPGRPDFVFRRERLAVFVDGCFWHGCVKHCRMPATNIEYWTGKIARNRQRDLAVGRLLRVKGWRVLRIWGHSLGKPAVIVLRIRRALGEAIVIARNG